MSSKPETNESLNIVSSVVSFFKNPVTPEDNQKCLDGLYAFREMILPEITVTDEEREMGLKSNADIRKSISPDDDDSLAREKNLAYIHDLNMNIRNWG